MANKTYEYEIVWCWKEDGNRNIEEITLVKATTVPRAISKLARELNEEPDTDDEAEAKELEVRASDLMVIDVRCHKLTNAIIAHKRLNGQSAESA